MTEDEIPVIFIGHARFIAARASYRWFHRIPAEDLCQIALLAGVLAFRTFEPGRGAELRTWIKRKMEYAVSDAFRNELHLGRKANSASTDELKSADARRLVAVTEWPHLDACLSTSVALKLLNPRERQIIDRRYFSDETQEEIAADLGITFGRVSQIEKAACLKMRAAFA